MSIEIMLTMSFNKCMRRLWKKRVINNMKRRLWSKRVIKNIKREGKEVVEEEEGNEDEDDDEGEEDEDDDDDEEEEEANPTYGTLRDGGMKLIGYKNSWASKIFATKNAVYDCVLWSAIEQAHHKFDAATVTAFAERAYPETDTFLLPFGEMAITPNDCYRITGLPITGTSGRAGYDPNMIFGALEKLVEKCLGWDSTKAQYEFRKAAKKPKRDDEHNPFNADRSTKKMLKKIKLNTLFDEFSGTRDKVLRGKLVMTEEKLTHHVTACAAVNAHYLQLLDPLDEVNNYCWSIAVLSFVQAELRKDSRLKSLYFGGLYTLVQVWVYDHFPSLKLSHPHDPWPYGKPTTCKYEFLNSQDKKKEDKVLRLREKLDDLTLEDVVFHPYAYNEDQYNIDVQPIDFSPVAGYNGPLFHPGCCDEAGNQKHRTEFCSQIPTPYVDHWNNFYDYMVPIEDLPNITNDPTACEEGYIEWYQNWSHPLVINHVQRARAEKGKTKMVEKEAQRIMKNTPKCGDEALMLWNAAVGPGNLLPIRTNSPGGQDYTC
ncbi:hypothetical protein C5167_000842 [Papaver somniferum]|uniref:Aminotransferase-like plant mobile domain-containing protein n=1 Tax=Papaver somniferum TaxID=3469 RepID=A0A4Y7KWC3_PAPSO|nr:hypothetical protein C5167_000842 [Papaver somniferum]